jgi:hypothetical protein
MLATGPIMFMSAASVAAPARATAESERRLAQNTVFICVYLWLINPASSAANQIAPAFFNSCAIASAILLYPNAFGWIGSDFSSAE